MPAPSRPNFVRRLVSFSRQLSSRPSRRGRMCKKPVTTTVGGSEASTGIASTPSKRRGRAQRRVSCEMRSWGGSWFLGYVRRRDEIATEKNAAAARRTIPEGSRTTFVVGAYSFWANSPVQPPNFPSQPVPSRLKLAIAARGATGCAFRTLCDCQALLPRPRSSRCGRSCCARKVPPLTAKQHRTPAPRARRRRTPPPRAQQDVHGPRPQHHQDPRPRRQR